MVIASLERGPCKLEASWPPLLKHITHRDSREFRKSHYSDGILLFRREEVRMRGIVKSTCSETHPVLLLVIEPSMHILMLVLGVGLGPGMWLWSLVAFVPAICLGLEIGFKGLVLWCTVRHAISISGILSPCFARLFSDPLLLRLDLST
jgi:hypothetical protein